MKDIQKQMERAVKIKDEQYQADLAAEKADF